MAEKAISARAVQDQYAEQACGLPEALRARAVRYAEEFATQFAGLPWEHSAKQRCLASAPRVFALSDFVAHTCLAHPNLLDDLITTGDLYEPPDPTALAIRWQPIITAANGLPGLKKVLRRARLRETVRIAWRDLAGWADLAEVMAGLSGTADFLIGEALAWLERAAAGRYGEPVGERGGKAVGLNVLALGKLGGGELNFSSDVDLAFAYPEDGATTGARAIDNHTFFVTIGQQLIEVLGARTEDGHVFRVDMRLRPDGESGPLALSFDALEQYYQMHGREWERYALVKARVVAGDAGAGRVLIDRLRPFVYRRYLDYGAIEAMREMKTLINRALRRKDLANNIKLGRGGIREIEFISQVLQLIHGGRKPELQVRALLTALQRLVQGGHLAPATGETLRAAYVFLRNTENRLQMIDDRQTHDLPADPGDRLRVALAMGYNDWDSFARDLQQHMQQVHEHFNHMFEAAAADKPDALAGVWFETLSVAEGDRALLAAGFDRPADIRALLTGLRQGAGYHAMSSRGRNRLDRLVPLLLEAAGQTSEPQAALSRVVNLIEAIGQRSAYFSLLIENPVALRYLVNLCGASPGIASWIAQHPMVLDELIDPTTLYAVQERDGLADELRLRLADTAPDDLETRMDVLREFRHGQVLRVAAADIGPGLAAEEISRRVTEIAEVVLEHSLGLTYRNLLRRYGDPDSGSPEPGPGVPGFAVIGYGKLGSLELGYGSDLDLVFLHAAPETAARSAPGPVRDTSFYVRLGQRLIHVLTARTRAGVLYETDMRLRPSGNSGPLITSVDAFREYQLEKAWTWEHQALVRARPIAGDPELTARFTTIRREVLCRPRELQALRQSVIEMRDKMRRAQPTHDPELFDIKHDRGGLVDIEFLVQYWVLRHASDHPALIGPSDNLGLLAALAGAGLIDPPVSTTLTETYRRYLAAEHRQKLMEHKPLVERAQFAGTADQVARIWDSVFGADS